MADYRIGLTGGVGSGKSTVAAMLEGLGAGLVDADALVHDLIAPGGAAVEECRECFGPAAIGADGGLDRAWMRARVFSDPEARRRLEAVLHPRVRAESEARALSLAGKVPYVVLMIPLLVESGNWTGRVQRVLVVDCTEATQVERVCRRPGMTQATARGILAAQATRAQRLAAADDVLFNELPLPELQNRVEALHANYLQRAA
ncbi:MAG TPA: dephospho-CoA kinase [Burkholderiaceae bacterium]|nr:dephospho-CoA kinase [Burkholderiaceae bacterium]